MLKLLLPAMLLASMSATAQENAPKPPKLFEDDSMMAITLTGPWRQIMRKKDSEQTFPGSLTYTTAAGESRTISVGLQTRGLTRRDKICDFPPLKIFFDKPDNKGTEFRGQESLKMVTYCQTDKRFQQYNLREFLAYRFYNLITPFSFRVRPLMVSYQEADSNRARTEKFGFLIEDVDDLADRNGVRELSIKNLRPAELDVVETANLSVFQYLISNLDWAVTAGPGGGDCCHNGKVIGASNEDRPVYAIPYDFDSSGLVDTHYAAPPTQLGVRKTTQRLYRGFCAHNEEIPAVLDRFRAQQPAMLQLIDQQSLLDGRSMKATRHFVESFFELIDSPAGVQEKIIGKCRG